MVDVASIVNLIATLAVLVGLVFGLIQLRQAANQRRDQAAVDIIRTVQTPEVRLAISKILALPDDTAPDVIRGDPELLAAALATDSACEMWGSMVFEGVVDHRMLDRMVGGWIRGSWERLNRWVVDEREVNRNPNVGEWWQWVYERLREDPDPGKAVGAHIAYDRMGRLTPAARESATGGA